MNRKLKAFGLGLLAVFAMSAVAASSASATTDVLTTTEPSALMTGISHDNIFNIPGVSSFQCTTAKFTATGENGSELITVDPSYEGKVEETPHSKKCTSSVGEVNEVKTNGCHYKLNGETTGEDPPLVPKDATVWIECPGNPIEIVSSLGVTISVPSQTPTTGGVVFRNLANHPGGSAVEVEATSTGITYTCAPAFFCELGGIPTHGNNATYKGTIVVTGYKDEDGLPTPITEGAQIPISTS